MNQETINQLSKYYPELSDTAKRQFAADLLEDSLKPGVISLIVNPETNEQINLQEVVKQKGKDVAVTVIQKILSNGINAKTGDAVIKKSRPCDRDCVIRTGLPYGRIDG